MQAPLNVRLQRVSSERRYGSIVGRRLGYSCFETGLRTDKRMPRGTEVSCFAGPENRAAIKIFYYFFSEGGPVTKSSHPPPGAATPSFLSTRRYQTPVFRTFIPKPLSLSNLLADACMRYPLVSCAGLR